jgi:hypothetical protein
MPSDEQTAAVLDALATPRDRFRSALAATVDGVHGWLDEHRANATDRRDHLVAEFGAMGDQIFSLDRLSTMIDTGPAVDASTLEVVERAYQQLQKLADDPDDGLVAVVPSGGSMRETVAVALARSGRAMGAARTVDLARQGRYRPADHEGYVESFPFGLWSHDERELAPPLVVSVSGIDLRPHALAEYLDGDMKFVLLVDEPATPAPLVRLVTPGVFVAQTTTVDVVERLAASDAPGVVAIMPEGSAEFIHDPAAGEGLAARLSVTVSPSGSGLHRVGPFTAEQQRDELQHLSTLAAAQASASPAEDGGGSADDPVGKLAAWLLTQANAADDAKGGHKGG